MGAQGQSVLPVAHNSERWKTINKIVSNAEVSELNKCVMSCRHKTRRAAARHGFFFLTCMPCRVKNERRAAQYG